MPTVKINGRVVEVPRSTDGYALREAGGVAIDRSLIRRTREGNYLVPGESTIDIEEGDTFIDAPARIKGGWDRGERVGQAAGTRDYHHASAA
jgi:hypothetical protein